MVNKNQSFITIIIFLLLTISIIEIVLAIGLINTIELNQGKNHIEINESMFVSELIIRYPEIESVSFYDNFSQKSIGYVNVFGGLGEDFLIIPGRTYEISSSKNFTINIGGG